VLLFACVALDASIMSSSSPERREQRRRHGQRDAVDIEPTGGAQNAGRQNAEKARSEQGGGKEKQAQKEGKYIFIM
jgi:hypothetical protein